MILPRFNKADGGDYKTWRENYRRAYVRDKRRRVIIKMGGKCQCCGEAERRFLEIDHVRNNGYKTRLHTGKLLTLILKNQVKMSELQLLCSNCNMGKYRNNGICPHEDHYLKLY